MTIINPGDGPANDAVWRRDVERRLRDLEVGRRSPNTVQQGGTFELRDADGDPVFYFGEFSRGGGTSFGVQAIVPDGAGPGTTPTVFEVDDDGLEAPYLPIPMLKVGDPVTVTNGTFQNIWNGTVGNLVAAAVFASIICDTDVGTTGEVRIEIVTSDDTATSDAVACGSGEAVTAVFRFLHGLNLGQGAVVNVQARRTGGAGGFRVQPQFVEQAGNDGIGATATGLP